MITYSNVKKIQPEKITYPTSNELQELVTQMCDWQVEWRQTLQYWLETYEIQKKIFHYRIKSEGRKYEAVCSAFSKIENLMEQEFPIFKSVLDALAVEVITESKSYTKAQKNLENMKAVFQELKALESKRHQLQMVYFKEMYHAIPVEIY